MLSFKEIYDDYKWFYVSIVRYPGYLECQNNSLNEVAWHDSSNTAAVVEVEIPENH